MNLDDRLHHELHDRSDHIDVQGAGSRAVIASARARTRRARTIGVAVALMLVAGVGGVALAIREDPSDSLATAGVDPTQDTDSGSSSADGTTLVEEPADTTGSPDQADNPSNGGADDIAVTESAAPTARDSAAAASESNDEPEDEPEQTPEAGPPATSGPQSIALVAHSEGFVAMRGGSALVFSSNLTDWSSIPDPRPKQTASITKIASHNGALYVAGMTSSGRTNHPWIAKSSDLSNWEQLSVPVPTDDGSPLTEITNTLYSLDVGSSGMIITGETLVVLDVAQLVSAEVFASDSWTLGDSQGDLTRIVVYDPQTGSPVDEIDLVDEGVPQNTLDLLADLDPTPFIALTNGSGDLVTVDADLESGTVISSTFIADGEYIGSGFSSRFASRVLWSSANGQAWEALPVSIVGANHAQLAGEVSGRVIAFTGQGPILTAQYRAGLEWTEVRLDRLFGDRNDNFQILDAAFGSGGVVAIVATLDEAQNEELYVLTSSDGTSWDVSRLSDLTPPGLQIVGIDSVAMGTSIAIGYQRADDSHETVSLGTS